MIWIASLLLALPTVERISPPGYSLVRYWDGELSAGEQWPWDSVEAVFSTEVFFWTRKTGVVWLRQVAPEIPAHASLHGVERTSGGWQVRLNSSDGEWLITLPLDVAQWFDLADADFDHDEDVDQTDFGLWQRTIGFPGAMSRDEMLRQMSGPR